MALRKRLNETVEELERIKKDYMELEVRFDTVNRELTVAKSDCEGYLFAIQSIYIYIYFFQ